MTSVLNRPMTLSARTLSEGAPDAADRCVDAHRCQSLGVSDRLALAASVAVMDQVVSLRARSLADGLVQSIQHETGRHRGGDTSADDLTGEDVDDGGDEDPVHFVVWAGLAVSGLVVMTFLPRTTPCNPMIFISRSTVQRAMSYPLRRN